VAKMSSRQPRLKEKLSKKEARNSKVLKMKMMMPISMTGMESAEKTRVQTKITRTIIMTMTMMTTMVVL